MHVQVHAVIVGVLTTTTTTSIAQFIADNDKISDLARGETTRAPFIEAFAGALEITVERATLLVDARRVDACVDACVDARRVDARVDACVDARRVDVDDDDDIDRAQARVERLIAAHALVVVRLAQRVSVLDARQLSIKLLANSLYGALGAGTSRLPDKESAAAITRDGRSKIMLTRERVMSHFTRANGYPVDARVIYGDTDSVFVFIDSSTMTLDEVGALGEAMAADVTAMFKVRVGRERAWAAMSSCASMRERACERAHARARAYTSLSL